MGNSTKRRTITTGQQFNMFTIIKEVDRQKVRWVNRRFFLCKCNCWIEKTMALAILTEWKVKSCWCRHRKESSERCKILWRSMATHWLTKTSIYLAWVGMKTRCYYTKDTHNKISYHDKWITVCDEWLHSFEKFYEDMWPKPKGKYSLDRINSEWNYCKDNCRRATAMDQANNRKSNHLYKWKTLSQRARETWMNKNTIRWRITHWKDVGI